MPGYRDPASGLTWGYDAGDDDWGGNLNRSLRTIAYIGSSPAVLNTLSAPPSTPSAGDAYILGASPSGAWSTFSQNDIVIWGRPATMPSTLAWQRFIPKIGQEVFNRATVKKLIWTGSLWRALAWEA